MTRAAEVNLKVVQVAGSLERRRAALRGSNEPVVDIKKGSNETNFYTRRLCFTFVYSVLNLLTMQFAGQGLHFHQDFMNA